MNNLSRTLTLVALLASCPNPLHAQSFALPWLKIAAGGGQSSSAKFSISGTIGQPDASTPLAGNIYSVTGGFWPGVTLLQTAGTPLLAAELLSGGTMRVSWPAPGTGFVLEETANLSTTSPAGSWTQVAFPYQTNATHISITLPPTSNGRFYRLRRP